MTSYTSIWVVIFSRDWRDFGGHFLIDTTSSDEFVDDLKTLVKNRRQDDLSRVDAPDLTVWRCKDRNTCLRDKDAETLVHQISKLLSEGGVEFLCGIEKLADLCISMEETLLVEVPCMSHVKIDSNDKRRNRGTISSKVDQEFESSYLWVHTKGKVTAEDIELNNIEDVYREKNVPVFVRELEKMLSQKRKVSDEMRVTAEYLVGKETSKQYFHYPESTEHPRLDPKSVSTIDRFEYTHFISVSNVYETELWRNLRHGKRRPFKEIDANWLFFYALKHHIVSASSDMTVIQSQESWPFQLVMQVGILGKKECYMYRPRSDFLILKSDLPRVAVKTGSNSPGRAAMDHQCLMLQGASIIRFANTYLEAYKEKRDFVFVAIFISDVGQADRYLIYQTKCSDTVYCKRKNFQFANQHERIGFLLELYNISSRLQNESQSKKEDTSEKVWMCARLLKQMKLPTFAIKTSLENVSDSDGGNQPGPSDHRKSGGDGGAIEQLKLCGYEVVPDILETKGGTWELLIKLPPHLRTVYQRSDPNKTELIAKHVRKGSNELDILEYLHTQRPQSPHVISLIEAIPLNTREWLILPKFHSIREDQYLMNRVGVSHRAQLGWGLIKGLAYLHEHKIAHRDIKPDNLVRDGDFCLKIIDFDVALRVQDENTEIDEYRGTTDWTAPEMGTQDGPTPMHSPIRADRWSCGRVLLHHFIVGKNHLQTFAHQLMAKDPQQRPSLLEWHKLTHDSEVEKSEGWQDVVGVDEESMKPPGAKKPRLE